MVSQYRKTPRFVKITLFWETDILLNPRPTVVAKSPLHTLFFLTIVSMDDVYIVDMLVEFADVMDWRDPSLLAFLHCFKLFSFHTSFVTFFVVLVLFFVRVSFDLSPSSLTE